MIQGIINAGSLPVLERLVQFTEARHRVLAHNIANLSTPDFQPADLDVGSFQSSLRSAIDRRRASADPADNPLEIRDTRQVRFRPDGIETRPTATNQGILFHDRNNRDLDRTMQHLAENTLAHNAAIELIRRELGVLEKAIRERA